MRSLLKIPVNNSDQVPRHSALIVTPAFASCSTLRRHCKWPDLRWGLDVPHVRSMNHRVYPFSLMVCSEAARLDLGCSLHQKPDQMDRAEECGIMSDPPSTWGSLSPRSSRKFCPSFTTGKRRKSSNQYRHRGPASYRAAVIFRCANNLFRTVRKE